MIFLFIIIIVIMVTIIVFTISSNPGLIYQVLTTKQGPFPTSELKLWSLVFYTPTPIFCTLLSDLKKLFHHQRYHHHHIHLIFIISFILFTWMTITYYCVCTVYYSIIMISVLSSSPCYNCWIWSVMPKLSLSNHHHHHHCYLHRHHQHHYHHNHHHHHHLWNLVCYGRAISL